MWAWQPFQPPGYHGYGDYPAYKGAWGKAKGKGKGTGDNIDKGKGGNYQGGENAAGYFFELYPEKNPNNYKVVKCKAPKCFGCTLLGPKPAKSCGWCQRPFDLEIATQNQARQRSKSPGDRSNKGNDPKSQDELKAKYEALLKDGKSVQEAANIIKVIFGISYSPVAPPAPSATEEVLQSVNNAQ